MGERKWMPLILLLVRCAAVLPDAANTIPGEVETWDCKDLKLQPVGHGEKYIPLGYDPCTNCTCYRGRAEMCVSTLCSPPKGCHVRTDSYDKCCDIECRGHPDEGIDVDGLNTTNLGLRLVASTVTSFLILALLLFMIHRLRQRRLLLMIRRLNGRQDGSYGSRRFSLEDDASVGYFAGVDRIDIHGPYEDPPPPYPFWKPPDTYFPHGEAPPPYEVLASGGTGGRGVGGACANTTANNNNYNNNNNNNQTLTAFPFVYGNFRSSLSQVALHTHNFQMNNLDRENNAVDTETVTQGHTPVEGPAALSEGTGTSLNLNVVGSISSLSSQSEQNDLLVLRSDAVYEEMRDPGVPGESNGTPERWPDETSSSSSQTYEPRTVSPSSSDSSSGDFGFQTVIPGGAVGGTRTKRQSNSLDRTLGNIKRRFSLGRRRSGPATPSGVPETPGPPVPPIVVLPPKPSSTPGPAPVVPRRAPRISYVSDDDLAVCGSSRPPVSRSQSRQGLPVGRRPRSYDFGDLRAPIREESSSASGTVTTTQTRTDGFRSSSSLDSLLCTCSSRASFGSLVGSASGGVREGPASPSSSCGPIGTDTLSGSFPASPDAEPEAPALPPRGARVAVAVPVSRSGSVCSETGERNPRGGNESYI